MAAQAAADPVSAIAGAAKSLFDVVGNVIKANSQALRDAVYSGLSQQDYQQNIQTGHQGILNAAIKERTSQNAADASMNVALVIGGVAVVIFLMYILFRKSL